jgi:hypothetical protein
MKKSNGERKSGNKERERMRSLTGDGEMAIEIEIAIGTNVADEWMKIRIAMIPAVIGLLSYPFVVPNINMNIKRRIDVRAFHKRLT